MGCLLFSFTIQMEEGRIVPLLQYVISLAITEGMNDLCDKEVSVLVMLPQCLMNGYSLLPKKLSGELTDN